MKLGTIIKLTRGRGIYNGTNRETMERIGFVPEEENVVLVLSQIYFDCEFKKLKILHNNKIGYIFWVHDLGDPYVLIDNKTG